MSTVPTYSTTWVSRRSLAIASVTSCIWTTSFVRSCGVWRSTVRRQGLEEWVPNELYVSGLGVGLTGDGKAEEIVSNTTTRLMPAEISSRGSGFTVMGNRGMRAYPVQAIGCRKRPRG